MARQEFASPAHPTSTEVKTIRGATGATSTTKATLLTPTSGTRVRVIAVICCSQSTTDAYFEVYFHTGANISTTASNAIYQSPYTDSTLGNPGCSIVFPDGAGPVGDKDEVVSIRTNADIAANGIVYLVYREEWV